MGAGLSGLLLGCSSSGEPPSTGGGDLGGVVPNTCVSPNDGCPCDTPGQVVDCGVKQSQSGDMVTCAMGSRTCASGVWGACITDGSMTQSVSGAGRYRLQGLGSSAACGSLDYCDPYCNTFTDTPTGLDGGAQFSTTPGLTPKQSVQASCTSLTVAAATPTATVTSIPINTASPPTVSLTATLNPVGCLSAPFVTSWTIDRFDLAKIGGSNNTNGLLTVLKPIVGTVTVTAYAGGFSGTTTVGIVVNVLDTVSTAITPNTAATNVTAHFGTSTAPLAGSAASTVTWLYPYAATYFPLGLPAPVMQYWWNSAAASAGAGDVKVSLRWPSGASATTASFIYALVAKEANTVSQTAGVASDAKDPQLVIPSAAWSAFEQTARNSNADLALQRYPSSGTLELESKRTIHFVDGQLKGTVYYNSYSSPQGGNTGAVLSIAPGATTPTLAVQPNGKCTVCHSLNLDGSYLIANGIAPGDTVTSNIFDQSHRFNMGSGAAPSPAVTTRYYYGGSGTDQDPQGNQFTFGAPRTDGSLYMTDGGGTTTFVGDSNWRSPAAYSKLYDPTVPGSPLTVSSWSNVSAVTPHFSPDGGKLAFGFWGGTGSTLPMSAGNLTSDPKGRTLAVVDFTANAGAYSVSNARNLTPGVTEQVAWPSFTPTNNAVIYQRQYRTSRSKENKCSAGTKMACTKDSDCTSSKGCSRAAGVCLCGANSDCGTGGACTACTTGTNCGVLGSAWSPSDINTVGGALSELWMSNVPATSATAATPTRLLALNGLTSAGASYLPKDSDRIAAPPATQYHVANASFTINQADNCGVTGTASGVNDYQLNYLPAVNPSAAAGFHWVVFTSRRMYGNIAYDDPWDAEPKNTSGVAYACNSGKPPTKKLWIAAVDSTFTPGTDPSHPAFYLPGQELAAGNSNGYWVNSACTASGATCYSSADCCTGLCDAVSGVCKSSNGPCAASGSACTQTSDCCTGLVCGGSGKCELPTFFGPQTFSREYLAVCPAGTRVSWGYFQWLATIPTGTSIDVSVQTRETTSDTYAPGTPLLVTNIATTVSVTPWGKSASTVNSVLNAASPRQVSRPYLLVTLLFKPDSTNQLAPTLTNWRQDYDCLPAE